MARQEWKGQVEPGIRKYLGPGGQRWYRVQMDSRGKGNRKSQVVATLEAAVALKRAWAAHLDALRRYRETRAE